MSDKIRTEWRTIGKSYVWPVHLPDNDFTCLSLFLTGARKRSSRKISFTPTDFVRKDSTKKSLTLGPKELPIAFDVLKTVVNFCYPGRNLLCCYLLINQSSSFCILDDWCSLLNNTRSNATMAGLYKWIQNEKDYCVLTMQSINMFIMDSLTNLVNLLQLINYRITSDYVFRWCICPEVTPPQ